MDTTIYYIIAGIIVLSAIYVSVYTGILKDVVKTDNNIPIKTYSFARTQGLWWTTIIASCVIISFGINGRVINPGYTCLTLLGIGIGTTAFGKVIDNYDLKAGLVRYQDKDSTKHFLIDILSDGTGISINRYQSLIFNLIFTVVFLVDFFKHPSQFPEFKPETLGLLGLSSSVYLGTKANENNLSTKELKAKQATDNEVKNQSLISKAKQNAQNRQIMNQPN
jgi:hypothetical protein